MNLRCRGAVLLISCYELGHQPAGIAWPAAFLVRAGYSPDVLDIAVERLDRAKVARARLVAISVPMHTALRLGVEVARQVRRINPSCRICFFGLYAWLNAEHLLSTVADFAIGGECEELLVSLIESLEGGDENTAGVGSPGHASPPFLNRLAFPVPNRDLLPSLSKYARLVDRGVPRLAGYVEASRGCLHHCLHCPIVPVYQGRLIVVSPEVVLADIRQQVAAGATHITFGDPDFLNGPGHSLRIARALHAEFPYITFDFTAKVEHLVRQGGTLAELAELGCLFVTSAVESLSDTVLGCLQKGHTRGDVWRALPIVRQAGMAFRPTWVSFTPWTMLDDYIDMLEFVDDEGLIDNVDPVQYAVRLLIPPGSALLTQSAIHVFLGSLDPASFSYPWKHPDPRMELLYRSVSALVGKATTVGEDPAETFGQVRRLAYAARGEAPPTPLWPFPAWSRGGSPRLSEPWFC